MYPEDMALRILIMPSIAVFNSYLGFSVPLFSSFYTSVALHSPYASDTSKGNPTLTFKPLFNLIDDILTPDEVLISIKRN
jgi:hypothetical protein